MSLKINVEQQFQNKLEQLAQSLGKTAEQLVNEAISEHLERLNEQRLQAETVAFEQLHPQLRTNYLGQFVAVYQGQVVETAEDFESLFLRIQRQYGELPVLIRQVSDSPHETWHFRSPRLESD